MNNEQYYLLKLAEEASEITQMALKTAQFGMDEVYVDLSNKQRLHAEINDLMAIISELNDKFNFGYVADDSALSLKKEKVKKYLLYSTSLGLVGCKQAEIDALKAQVAEIEKPKVCVYTKNGPWKYKTSCGANIITNREHESCIKCGCKVEVR